MIGGAKRRAYRPRGVGEDVAVLLDVGRCDAEGDEGQEEEGGDGKSVSQELGPGDGGFGG